MTFAWAFTVLVGIYYVSTVINSLTRGRIGTAFTSFVLMLLGFWSGLFPKDIVGISELHGLYSILNLTILIHVGTSFDPKQFKREWRLVVIIIAGILGMAFLVFTVGGAIFGTQVCIAGFPVYLGAVVALNIMHQAAVEAGSMDLAAFVLLIQATQALIGIPLIGTGVRMEGRRLLGLKSDARLKGGPGGVAPETYMADGAPKLIDRLPKRLDNPFLHLLLAAFYGALAELIARYTGALTGGIIGVAVVGIVLGMLLRQLGLISRNPIDRAGLMPVLLFAMITVMRSSLAELSPYTLLEYLVPLLGLFAISAAGMYGAAYLVGRKLGYHKGMIMACVFCCFAGYPLNYQVALENIQLMTEDAEEREYLKNEIVPKIVLGSVLIVSVTSVILAGIFSTML